MLQWLIFAGLTAAALVAVAAPLLGRVRAHGARANAADVYADQIREVEAQAARGNLSVAEAGAARTEISRRLLALGAEAPVKQDSQARPQQALALALVIAATAGALGLYLHYGNPGAPDVPLASRAEEIDRQRQYLALVAELERRLKAEPEQPEGWKVLAEAYVNLGRYADAAAAFREASTRNPDPELLAAWAESIVFANDGRVTPEAMEVIDRILAAEPEHGRALYYRGIGREQAGDYDGAIADWTDVLNRMPEGLPVRRMIEARIAAAKEAKAAAR